MSAPILLAWLREHCSDLRVEGENLRFKVRRGSLDAERSSQLRQHKAEIMALLHASEPNAQVEAKSMAPLSAAQRQLWLLDSLAPNNAFYNNPNAWLLSGQLDLTALRQSLHSLLMRHDILRVQFLEIDGEPYQRCTDKLGLSLPTLDLRELSQDNREHRMHTWLAAESLQPFDLRHGPVIRFGLLQLTDTQHVLFVNVHHIVADGWSIGIIVSEIFQGYALARRALPEISRPSYQYFAYAQSAQKTTQNASAEQIDYWRKQLADTPALLRLPTDFPRPAVQSFRGAHQGRVLPKSLLDSLEALAKRNGCTLFSVLVAVFALLLERYSQQSDLSIGTPFSGRDRAELEPLVGHFINTAVLRVKIDHKMSFLSLMQQLRNTLLEAYEHQDLPFEQVVQALAPERNPSYAPLFQVIFALHNMPLAEPALGELVIVPIALNTASAKFDLSFEATASGEGLKLAVEYASDLFAADTIARMIGHYQNLLTEVIAGPELAVASYSMLSQTEREFVSEVINDNAFVDTQADTLVARFSRACSLFPNQIAVADEELQLSYSQLRQHTWRWAQQLRAMGVGKGSHVALAMRPSARTIVLVLAVLQSGAAYLPLEFSHPKARLLQIVESAQAKLVFCDADLQHAPDWIIASTEPNGAFVTSICLEAGAVVDQTKQYDQQPRPEVLGEDPAYLIYTSGSSGAPKGVSVSHRSITNLLSDWQNAVGRLENQNHAWWCSFAFDVSVFEIFLPLCSGNTLNIVADALRLDPPLLLDWMVKKKIAAAYLPPAFVQWIGEDIKPRCGGLALRQLLVGVEPLSERLLYDLQQELPGLRIVNGYGPTEATVFCTRYQDFKPLDRRCPIGKAVGNTQIYLLDQQLRPVPIGVAAEIYVGGSALCLAYYQDPILNAKKFIDYPSVGLTDQQGNQPQAAEGGRAAHARKRKLYRTGDYGVLLPCGNVQYHSRQDDQIKFRGYRIELTEVSVAIEQLTEVAAAYSWLDSERDQPQLATALVMRQTLNRSVEEWRLVLGERLPQHMIPTQYLCLPSLPRTSNGKVDQAALQLLLRQQSGPLQVNLTSPRDHIELALYQIWLRLLLQRKLGIRSNFFEAGGSSIAAIKLAHAINAEFACGISLREIMLHPTIEAQAALIRQADRRPPVSNLIEFRAGTGVRNATGTDKTIARVVCVHPAGGTAFCYLSLAKVLPETVGVYGIQSIGVNVGEQFLPTVEAMAAAYLQLIADFRGPLVLTGLSYGGLIAYHMAVQLARAGKTDLSLVLMDTQGIEEPQYRAMVSAVPLAEFRDKLVKFNGMYPGIDDAQIEQYYNIYNHNRMSMRDYQAPNYDGRLVLIQAMGLHSRGYLRDLRQFWQRRALGGLLVKQVRGDHWEMLETAELMRVDKIIRAELHTLGASFAI
jgi:amino acid adenylation domain-containing protein